MNVFDSADSDFSPPPPDTAPKRVRERLTSPGLRPSPMAASESTLPSAVMAPWEPTVPALVDALLALDPVLLQDGRPIELPPPPPWGELSSSLQLVAELYATVSPTLDPHSRTAARRFIAALRTVADTVSPRGLPAASTDALWSILATLRGEPSPVVLRRLGPRAARVEAIWAPLRSMLIDLEHVDLDVIERVLAGAAPLVVAARAAAPGGRPAPTSAEGRSALATAEYTGDGVMITLRSPSGDVVSTFGRTAAGLRDRPLSTLLPAATAPSATVNEPRVKFRRVDGDEASDGTVQETLWGALGIASIDAAPDASTRRAERRAALRGLALANAAPRREGLSADTRAWLRRLERSPLPSRLSTASRVAVDLWDYVTATSAAPPALAPRALADVELMLLDVDGALTLVAVCLTDVATDGRARRAATPLRPALDAWRSALSGALGLATLDGELCFPLVPLSVRL